jgi:hypothetical protein
VDPYQSFIKPDKELEKAESLKKVSPQTLEEAKKVAALSGEKQKSLEDIAQRISEKIDGEFWGAQKSASSLAIISSYFWKAVSSCF